jgi:hypothetical protein
MNQVPIRPDIATEIGTNWCTPRETSSAQESAIASHIMQQAITFARRGMRTPGSMYLRNGPKNRFRINRSVSQGHDRAKHHVAKIKKIVVGIPGTTTPTPAMPTHPTPAPASAYRTGRAAAGVGFRSGEAAPCRPKLG